MSDYKPPAISRSGMTFESEHALRDVQAKANEYGTLVRFFDEDESSIRRSRYNSIKSHSVPSGINTIYALPVDNNPSKYTLEKIGLSEDTQLVLYTPMQSWIDEGLTIDDIDMVRWKMEVHGIEYKITTKKEYDQFGDVFLYIVLGGKEE